MRPAYVIGAACTAFGKHPGQSFKQRRGRRPESRSRQGRAARCGRLVESGATSLGGSIPINPSGGLVSKGHPIGATGLSMIYELCLQLRGEAGERQVKNAALALAENGGGVMGFDEAACSITILEKDR